MNHRPVDACADTLIKHFDFFLSRRFGALPQTAMSLWAWWGNVFSQRAVLPAVVESFFLIGSFSLGFSSSWNPHWLSPPLPTCSATWALVYARACAC